MPEFTFPLYFKLIDHYQREDPILTEKLTYAEYKKGSFCGVWITIKLITYKDKIVIPQKLLLFILKWYHKYLLFTGWDILEAIFIQDLYWPEIRNSVQKNVTECDVCQRTKHSTKQIRSITC